MRPDFNLNSIRKRHGRVTHAVAILFLLYTGGDILLPQYFCSGEEIGGLPLQITVSPSKDSKSDDTRLASVRTSDDLRPEQPQDQAPREEDCFCCCAHVLPGCGFTGVISYEPGQLSIASEVNSPPSPPLPNTYRPPRFA